MAHPYDEAQGLEFQQKDVQPAYAEAGHSLDLGNVIWSNRMTYDAVTIGYSASRSKHRRELRRHLGLDQPGPVPPGAVHGRLRVEGNRFFDTTGPFRWLYVTAFDHFRLFCLNENVAQYTNWVLSVKANGVRVFGNWSVTGFDFRNHPGTYFPLLDNYLSFMQSCGLRVEFCAGADFNRLGISEAEQHAFLNACADVCAQHENVTLEQCNEPWKNGAIPEGGIDIRRPGLLVARGAIENSLFKTGYVPSLGYTTVHQPRDAEWWRKAGKDCGVDAHEFTRDVVIPDEPMKMSLDSDLANWRRAGFNAAMFCGGITAHGNSDTLQLCKIPSQHEEALIRTMLDAARRVHPDAPTWSYRRNGPSAPAGGMPVSNEEGRVYAKVDESGGRAVVLNMYDDNWTPIPINGWKIDVHDGPYVEMSR